MAEGGEDGQGRILYVCWHLERVYNNADTSAPKTSVEDIVPQ
jgi:hypothetical protein